MGRQNGVSLLEHVFALRSYGVGSVFVRKPWYARAGEMVLVTDVLPVVGSRSSASVIGVRVREQRGLDVSPLEVGKVRGLRKRDWAMVFDAERLESVVPRSLRGEFRDAWCDSVLAGAVEEAEKSVLSPDWHIRVRKAVSWWREALGEQAGFRTAPGCGVLAHVPPARATEEEPPRAQAPFLDKFRIAHREQVQKDAILREWQTAKDSVDVPKRVWLEERS